MNSKKIPSPRKRNAENTYFDREMCRFHWEADYVQSDVRDLVKPVSGNFVDVLDNLKKITSTSYRFAGEHDRWFPPAITISGTRGLCLQQSEEPGDR